MIYAINAGGEAHVDVYGIKYQRDPLRSVGTASDYGKQLLIGKSLLECLAFFNLPPQKMGLLYNSAASVT